MAYIEDMHRESESNYVKGVQESNIVELKTEGEGLRRIKRIMDVSGDFIRRFSNNTPLDSPEKPKNE